MLAAWEGIYCLLFPSNPFERVFEINQISDKLLPWRLMTKSCRDETTHNYRCPLWPTSSIWKKKNTHAHWSETTVNIVNRKRGRSKYFTHECMYENTHTLFVCLVCCAKHAEIYIYKVVDSTVHFTQPSNKTRGFLVVQCWLNTFWTYTGPKWSNSTNQPTN